MTAPPRILLAAGDAPLREALAEQFDAHDRFETVEAATGAEAVTRARNARIDLILVDGGLPDRGGLCRRLRGHDAAVPIILLTGEEGGHEPDADETIAKPFRLGALLARVRAWLRRREDAAFAVGPYRLRPGANRLVDAETGAEVRLTGKEAAILEYLHRAGDRAVDRAVLLGEVWGYRAAVATHTLETHIYRLRRKIERDPARAHLLVTEPGGYRLAR